MLPVVGRKQIFYKHGHGHGTAAAGHGRDSSGNLFDCLKIHVAAQFSVNEICTYVKHNRSVGTMSAVTSPALPVQDMIISDLRHSSFKLLVLLWQTVTVAFSFKSISASGLPTTLLLPSTQTFFPLSEMPVALQQLYGSRRRARGKIPRYCCKD